MHTSMILYAHCPHAIPFTSIFAVFEDEKIIRMHRDPKNNDSIYSGFLLKRTHDTPVLL